MHTRTDKKKPNTYTGALADRVDGSYSSLLQLPATVPPLLPPAVYTTYIHAQTKQTHNTYTGALANCVDGSYSGLLQLQATVPPLLPPAVYTTCIHAQTKQTHNTQAH